MLFQDLIITSKPRTSHFWNELQTRLQISTECQLPPTVLREPPPSPEITAALPVFERIRESAHALSGLTKHLIIRPLYKLDVNAKPSMRVQMAQWTMNIHASKRATTLSCKQQQTWFQKVNSESFPSIPPTKQPTFALYSMNAIALDNTASKKDSKKNYSCRTWGRE